MNTIFKLYYQAWVLLAIVSAYSLYYFAARLRGVGMGRQLARYAWWGILVVLVACSLIYPVAATWSKSGAFVGSPALNGLAFVERTNPAEYEAIRWLDENVDGSLIVVEATGGEYSEYGRVAARTGLPTLLGWAGHEVQWRGTDRDFRGRAEEIDQIYQSKDRAKVDSLLEKYSVTYVYVGHLERAKYGQEAGEHLATFMDVAFENEGVTIYQVRQDR